MNWKNIKRKLKKVGYLKKIFSYVSYTIMALWILCLSVTVYLLSSPSEIQVGFSVITLFIVLVLLTLTIVGLQATLEEKYNKKKYDIYFKKIDLHYGRFLSLILTGDPDEAYKVFIYIINNKIGKYMSKHLIFYMYGLLTGEGKNNMFSSSRLNEQLYKSVSEILEKTKQ